MAVSAMRWRTKLATLLGTPPEQILYEQPQEAEEAAAVYRRAVGLISSMDVPDMSADQAAVALEYPPEMVGFPLPPQPHLCFKHPLSGDEYIISQLPNIGQAQQTILAALAALSLSPDASMEDYLTCWRRLPEQLRRVDGQHAPFWTLLPASQVIPSYTTWDHRAMASAIAGAGQTPAFLIFTIASAQDFISAARRTQDFWISSYLLSYLSWTAMRVIVERYGPDALVYPSMRDQPIVDWWLSNERHLHELKSPNEDLLSIANAPNVFTAIVPASDLEVLVKDCIKAVTAERDAMSNAVAHKFAEFIHPTTWDGKDGVFAVGGRQDEILTGTWKRQVAGLFQDNIFWSAYVWHDSPQRALAAYTAVVPPQDRHVHKLERFFANGIGAAYPLMSALASRALEARKSLRDFIQVVEPNHHCSQCGIREALHPHHVEVEPARFEPQLRQFWEKVQQVSRGLFRSGDRLCAVCVMKRLAAMAYFVGGRAPGVIERFPSTTSIAVAKYKEHLVRAIVCGEIIGTKETQDVIAKLQPVHIAQLREAVGHYVRAIQVFTQGTRLDFTRSTAPLPRARQFAELARPDNTLLDFLIAFLKIDGDWLFEESFDPEKIAREYGERTIHEGKRREALSALRQLLSVVVAVKDELREKDISWAIPSQPKRYLAILFADGDKMGDWVSGKQLRDQRLTYEKYVPPPVAQRMDQDLLKTPKFVSPSLHYAISSALSNYAVMIVRHVVEKRYGGKLVYAGGDDVKALVPVEDILPVMHELQLLYRGAEFEDHQSASKIASHHGFVELEDRLLMMMGTKASMSIGVAIVHHTHPLGHAIAESAVALKAGAKDGRAFAGKTRDGKGRAAFAVYLYKRSGEALQVGAKWISENNEPLIPVLRKVVRAFQTGWLSSKLAYRMSEDAGVYVASNLLEAARADLKRLFGQHAQPVKEGEDHARCRLIQHLDTLLQDQHIGWVGVARLLLLARFIAQEGAESD